MTILATGPTIKLREPTPGDLSDVISCLEDWELIPTEEIRIRNFMRGALANLRRIERPYKDTSSFSEMQVVELLSNSSVVGFMSWKVTPGKVIQLEYSAAKIAERGKGYMKEASLIRNAVLFDKLSCASTTTTLIDSMVSAKSYHTTVDTFPSRRLGTPARLVTTTKSSWDTWKQSNSIPSYTYTGDGYVPPHLR